MTTGHDGLGTSSATRSEEVDRNQTTQELKDREILRLQRNLTEAKTTNRARESQLRVAKEGLKNAREALNETFAEYTNVREELSTVKHVLGRDHQAVLYRKDIELFALRKMNEQREKSLTERDAKLMEMECQHKAVVELKDEQTKRLKDRLAVLELQCASRQDTEDGAQALEVRLLKVRKGRKSLEIEDDKDALISQLQEHLAAAKKSVEAVVNQQAELQRAWDITKKIQDALKDERDRHAQTREQLQGALIKLSEESKQEQSPTNSIGRLPTIEEDEHDRSELEAMFETAQEDNIQLKTHVGLMEKRLRDANAKLFSAAQEAEALREQIRFEQNRKAEIENARPSVVHHVHLQHMEEQVRALQDILEGKDEEIKRHRKSLVDIDRYVGRLRREIEAAIGFHTEDQDEIERLKETISELQSTKRQLMVDHEQRASSRVRPRTASAKQTSAQTDGAPFIQKPISQLTESGNASKSAPTEVLPPVLISSEQSASVCTGRRGSASREGASQSKSTADDEPTVDLREERTSRRTSLGLRDMMRRIARKDQDDLASANADTAEECKIKKLDRSGDRVVSNPAESRAASRPGTADASTTAEAKKSVGRKAVPTITSVPHKTHPSNPRRTSMRYYTTTPSEADERPQTAASKAPSVSKRRSWGANVQ